MKIGIGQYQKNGAPKIGAPFKKVAKPKPGNKG